MILAIEAFVLCVMFSVMVYVVAQEPIKTLYNYPPKIQERICYYKLWNEKIVLIK